MTKISWHRLMLAALLVASACVRVPAVAADADPRASVVEATDQMLAVLDAGRDYFGDDPERFYAQLDGTLAPYVDFAGIARAVMAGYWNQASADERVRFETVFRRGLVRSYGKAMMQFEPEAVEVLPVPPEHRRDGKALVRMQITAANGSIYPIHYSMALGDDDRWRIRNVIVDGVNLGLTYRSQFASAMQSPDRGGDIAAVIESWTFSDVSPAES